VLRDVVHVNGSPSPSELDDIYNRRFAEMADYRRAIWAVLAADVFQRYVPVDGVVLDLGCGRGEFINQILAARKFGIDLNPSSREHLDRSVTLFEQDSSTRWQIEDRVLDAVFTSNFFEHLKDKSCLQRTLQEAYRCLKPGGSLICLGPNIKYLAGAYWDFWDHHLPLTEESLKEVLELTGFETAKCVPRFLPYSMSQGARPPLLILKLYLRLPILWPLFGRQFLVVGVKN